MNTQENIEENKIKFADTTITRYYPIEESWFHGNKVNLTLEDLEDIAPFYSYKAAQKFVEDAKKECDADTWYIIKLEANLWNVTNQN